MSVGRGPRAAPPRSLPPRAGAWCSIRCRCRRTACPCDNTGVSDAPAILVRDLRKTYDAFEAVRGIDFEVARGEVFGLLGPNGAGKTTTVEILEGYRKRDAGEVEVFETDPATAGGEFRERIGVV